MKCSHGLAFEVRCAQCFSEAMSIVLKTSAARNVVAAAKPCVEAEFQGKVFVGIQEELDHIQGLS